MAPGQLVALLYLAPLRDVHPDQLVDTRGQFVSGLAGELLDVYHLSGLAVRDLERGVPHLAGLLPEDGPEQLLFGGKLGLALGGHLPHQYVAGLDVGPDSDYTVLVQVPQHILLDVGDVGGYLLVTELGAACLDLVFLYVNGGQYVISNQPLADHDSVLEVVPLPGHERDQQVPAQRQLTQVGAGAVADDLAFAHLLADLHDGALVDTGTLVGAREFMEVVGLLLAVPGLCLDGVGVHEGHLARGTARYHVSGVLGGTELHPGGHQRSLGLDERHRLALHVRTHQGSVGVIMLQERYQGRGHANRLPGGYVHIVNHLGGHRGDLFPELGSPT